MPGVPVIEVKQLAKTFGHHQALRDVSFSVRPGDIYGFLGRNGAGKSTTIRAMLGLVRPDGGTLEIFGKDVRRHRNEILGEIGSIVEKPDFYKYLSARRNLEVLSRAYGRRVTASRISDMLAFVGLAGREDDRVGGFSHGMRQRLGIAQALLHDPGLIILDEPTTGLDPRSRLGMWDVIRGLVRDGTTLLLTTQYLEEADELAQDIVVVDHGRIIAHGTADQLKRQVGGERIEVHVNRAEDVPFVEGVLARHGGGDVTVDAATRYLSVAAGGGSDKLFGVFRELDEAGIAVDDIGMRRPTLDDVFLSLTGHVAEVMPEDESVPVGARSAQEASS